MTEVVMIIFFMILLFAAVSGAANHIPKTGRCFDADGQEVIATITNTNRTAEKAVTIRAIDDNGRRYRAKLKASEAKLWIRGDKIRIILSDRSKNYRILFHEYFKENEQTKRLERTLPLEIFDYQYNNTPINYMNNKVKVARKELIYKNKLVMNREKDLFDIKNLEPTINIDILTKLKNLSKIRKTQTITVK